MPRNVHSSDNNIDHNSSSSSKKNGSNLMEAVRKGSGNFIS